MWTRLSSYASGGFIPFLRMGCGFFPLLQISWETSVVGKARQHPQDNRAFYLSFFGWIPLSRQVGTGLHLWLKLALALVPINQTHPLCFHCWPWLAPAPVPLPSLGGGAEIWTPGSLSTVSLSVSWCVEDPSVWGLAPHLQRIRTVLV